MKNEKIKSDALKVKRTRKHFRVKKHRRANETSFMIGYFDYTVILTYLSIASASAGIIASLYGACHPFIGTFFLLFCGLCDAFDGKVARMKQNRTESEKKYGIQIDSLSDLVAFGVLPCCIGAAMFKRFSVDVEQVHLTYAILMFTVVVIYVLAALIRLAYFNVQEEERQKLEPGARKSYTGLPVTSAALIFPTVMLIQYLVPADITPVYLAVMLFTAFAFVSKIKVKKPGLRGILIMVGIGLIEFIVLAILYFLNRR